MVFSRILDAGKQVRHAWYPWLRTLPLEIKILTGHRNYTPFIILGRSRVGSNLLRGLLNAHRQISAYGEIFRDVTDLDWEHMGYFQTPKTVTMLQEDSAKFIRQKLFGRYPRYLKAVGFKIFYYHAQNTGVWEYLQAETNLRVLHLKRKNILKTHLSRKKAAATDLWVKTSHRQEGQTTFELEYDECLNDFVRTRQWEQKFDAFFQSHPMLEIFYEDLAANRAQEMRRVEQFLGVDFEAVQPSTRKQSKAKLSETILNYDALKSRFAGLEWESFFED